MDASPFVPTCAVETVYVNVTVLAIARPNGKAHQSLEAILKTAAAKHQTPSVSMASLTVQPETALVIWDIRDQPVMR